MSYRKKDTNIRFGVILPTYFTSSIITDVVIVLDENNRLWQAPKSVLESSRISSAHFEFVYFKYDENGITLIDDLNSVTAAASGSVRTITELDENNYCKIPTDEINNVDFNYYRLIVWNYFPLTVIGYLRGNYDINIGFNKDTNYRIYGWLPNSYEFIEPDENIILKRYFIQDYNETTYREINSGFVEVINQLLTSGCLMQTSLPISANEIKEIYDSVSSFNPYEAFESFRIRQVLSTKTYRDFFGEEVTDRYTYKKNTMRFFDSYLNKWFPIPSGQDPSGFDSNGAFHISWPDDTPLFDKEENEIKEKAYAEYNKQEHLDFLMYHLYTKLKERIDKVLSREIQYQPIRWLPEYLKIKDVYKLLNLNLYNVPRDPRMTEDAKQRVYKERLTYTIENINKVLDN